MGVKITRRELAAALGSAASMGAARAQEKAASQPQDLEAQAKDQLHKDSEAIARVELPMSTEPAFLFKA